MKRSDAAQTLVHDMEEAPQSESRPRRRSVLVPLHGKRAPASALAMARLVASVLDVPLRGMFISPEPLPSGEALRRLHVAPHALEDLEIDVEVGEPLERLAAFAERSPTSLVVLETDPARHENEGLGLGEFAMHVLETSRAPVLLVPPGTTPRLERILVPLDGTPSTASALEAAGELARDVGASLDVLLVGEAQHGPAFSDAFLHQMLSVIGDCPAEVTTRFHVGTGDSAAEILRFVGDLAAHLTVLAWNGHMDDGHGASFRTVLERANSPVLVLRG